MLGGRRHGRTRALLARLRSGIEASFSDDESPGEIAASFALGVFLTMLPTLGVNLLVMAILAARVERVNPVALFASGIVVNPAVKWGIYAVSIPLGVVLLGPLDGGIAVDLSLLSNRPLFLRLFVGTGVLAVIATPISYVVIRRMVVAYRDRHFDVVEQLVDVVIEELDEEIEREAAATAADQPESTTTTE